nr:MAG TPA: hypothetical protein [Caudoviricetes sp.]
MAKKFPQRTKEAFIRPREEGKTILGSKRKNFFMENKNELA